MTDLIVFSIYALIACGALAAIWWVLTRRKNEGTSGRCGWCGYSVEGLESMACPDCGKDLRQVGITRAYQLSKAYLILLIVTLAGMLAALVRITTAWM